jgi:hypothetical protein
VVTKWWAGIAIRVKQSPRMALQPRIFLPFACCMAMALLEVWAGYVCI